MSSSFQVTTCSGLPDSDYYRPRRTREAKSRPIAISLVRARRGLYDCGMADEISTDVPETPQAPEPAAERWLKIVLRVVGAFLLPALIAVVMPRSWIASAHRQLGLGELAGGVLVEYLARTLSAFYAVVGGLLWLLSCDVRKYLAVIRYIAVTWLALGMVVVAILAPHSNQPFYWLIVTDAAVAWLCSLAMLVLAARVSP